MERIGVIGIGHVGAEVSYTLVRSGLVEELVLIDKDEGKATAEKLELEDAMAYTAKTKIYTQDYELLNKASIVVVSIGDLDSLMPDRMVELKNNARIVQEVIPKVVASGFSGIFLVISNPCDVITQLVQKVSGFPYEKVIGTGTSLDTMRLKRVLSEKTETSPQAIDGFVMGEHGESQFVAWSSVKIGGIPAKDHSILKRNSLDAIKEEVREGGWLIFTKKGWTNYGIATATVRISEAILKNENMLFPLSVFDTKLGVYIGRPAFIKNEGISSILPLDITEEEKVLYEKSAGVIKEAFHSISM